MMQAAWGQMLLRLVLFWQKVEEKQALGEAGNYGKKIPDDRLYIIDCLSVCNLSSSSSQRGNASTTHSHAEEGMSLRLNWESFTPSAGVQ